MTNRALLDRIQEAIQAVKSGHLSAGEASSLLAAHGHSLAGVPGSVIAEFDSIVQDLLRTPWTDDEGQEGGVTAALERLEVCISQVSVDA